MADRVLRRSTRAASAPANQVPTPAPPARARGTCVGRGGVMRGRGGRGGRRGGAPAPSQAPPRQHRDSSSSFSELEEEDPRQAIPDQSIVRLSPILGSSPASFNVGEGTPPPRDSASSPRALERTGDESDTPTPKASVDDINMPDDLVNAGIAEEAWQAGFDHINFDTPHGPAASTPNQAPTSQLEPSSPVVKFLRRQQGQQAAKPKPRGRSGSRSASASRTKSASATRCTKRTRQPTTPGSVAEQPTPKCRGRSRKNAAAAPVAAEEPAPMDVDLADVEQTLSAPWQRRVSFHEDVRGGSSSNPRPAQTSQQDSETVTLTLDQLERMVNEGVASKLMVEASAKPKPRTIPDDAGASQPARQKPPHVINLDREQELEPNELILPSHVINSLELGWVRWFPLSDVSVENCLASVKRKADNQRSEVVVEGGRIYAHDALTPTDFLTIRYRLVQAIDRHFLPQRLALQLGGQVDSLFEMVSIKRNFKENFHRYREYTLEVLRRFVDNPTFNLSKWQLKIWAGIVERDMDRVLKAAALGSFFPEPFRAEGGDAATLEVN
ncbi:hypothetical protein R3P38DRAFT_2815089 [Favolaschia claudopus]|uniref:Uncharacterized protein n=1 Tax=Favolaschia claudopus TaxID=2862362 RepID=A0AAV9Z3I0_9AGAR